MERSRLILPKLANSLYISKDAPEVLTNFDAENQELAGDFFYADQISLKLQEAISLIKDSDLENSLLRKIRDKWSKDIQDDFINAGILYESKLRRKSVFSILQKFNRIMAGGYSINSMHDLMGMEFVIFTPTKFDTPESSKQLYEAANIILRYFSNSKRAGERFMICDASPLKDVYSLEDLKNKAKRIEITAYLQSLNPYIYIPKKTGLSPEYVKFVKDYFLQPKLKGYQGLQFVIKTADGFYIEIQIKTQPIYSYKNNPKSPIFHKNYRKSQTQKSYKQAKKCTVPQFDLRYNPEKVNIYGFRDNPDEDTSGIISPTFWTLRKNTHF